MSTHVVSLLRRAPCRPVARLLSSNSVVVEKSGGARKLVDDGLTLSDFVRNTGGDGQPPTPPREEPRGPAQDDAPPSPAALGDEFDDDAVITDAFRSRGMVEEPTLRLGRQMRNEGEHPHPHLRPPRHTLRFHLKTYGCQMNVNDTDIVRSLLRNNHIDNDCDDAAKYRFVEVDDEIQADVLLTNTCAIRDNAEQKVWHRLRSLRAHDRNFPLSSVRSGNYENLMDRTKETRKQLQHKLKAEKRDKRKRIIGVLGCMAERLKEDMFERGTADLVVGPDAYRDLARLISVLVAPSLSREGNVAPVPTERAVNVQLSLDETYASINPIRSNPQDVSAFVSIMRGCNNMCSYCVVPFTRGRERSRELESVVAETRRLLEEEDVKEVILLGQNVNSYHDKRGAKGRGRAADSRGDDGAYRTSNDGFSNVFRLRHGDGHRFADLLEAVSSLSPELRVRFTSPHPKDYPPALLQLMAERANICNHLHMPAQSGSSAVLERMRRGYSREAYLELIQDVRTLLPEVAISSDFITGFCGETEEEHRETLSLMELVQFDQAFMFAYSMRAKTHAHRTMDDDVSAEVKHRRLNEVIEVFRRNVQLRNEAVEVGKLRLVLIEGESKRSTPESRSLSGRTDENKRVIFPERGGVLPNESSLVARPHLDAVEASAMPKVRLERGDYAVVRVTEAKGHTLKGEGLCRSSIVGFNDMYPKLKELY